MLLQSWLDRLRQDFVRYAPDWADATGFGRTLEPAVVPVWSGAPGDVRRRGGRRARRRASAQPAGPPEWGPRQRLA
ncbi:hypothetical protein [Alienimonas sp. DA493]|uniref:hypothetical protein n=1 Tax=Alienimonas sp. DA493 TaxID=3373605 RepID=UPI00375427D1